MARTAFWTIIVDEQPTAFRAAVREDLLPTLKQLQRQHPTAAIKWFQRGRLWETPGDAMDATKPPRRPVGWRPGGEHKDPRDRYNVPRDVKRARWASQAAEGRGPWVKSGTHEGRKPGGQDGRPPRKPFVPRDGDRPAWKPKADRPAGAERRTPASPRPRGEGGPNAEGRPAWTPRGDRPSGDRPAWKPKGDRPTGDRPAWKPKSDRPTGDRPAWKPKGDRPTGDRPAWKPQRTGRPEPGIDRRRRARTDRPAIGQPWKPTGDGRASAGDRPAWKPKARSPTWRSARVEAADDRPAAPRRPASARAIDRRGRPAWKPKSDGPSGDRPAWKPKGDRPAYAERRTPASPKPSGDRFPKADGPRPRAGGPGSRADARPDWRGDRGDRRDATPRAGGSAPPPAAAKKGRTWRAGEPPPTDRKKKKAEE